MTSKHPYVQAPKHLSECIAKFRRSVPPSVTASTLQKLGIASKNERYLLTTLRFLGLIDASGKPTQSARELFSRADDGDFQSTLSDIVRTQYKDLFQLRGEDVWAVNKTDLVTYFRGNDQTSAIVGQRQATTFHTLRVLCGYATSSASRQPPTKSHADSKSKGSKSSKRSNAKAPVSPGRGADARGSRGELRERSVGLTVRIEINLPADGDQATYDSIFRSIRDNLINE